jgi:hypothetical protein
MQPKFVTTCVAVCDHAVEGWWVTVAKCVRGGRRKEGPSPTVSRTELNAEPSPFAPAPGRKVNAAPAPATSLWFKYRKIKKNILVPVHFDATTALGREIHGQMRLRLLNMGFGFFFL